MFGEVGTEHLQDICIAEVIKEELMVHGSVPKATERGGGWRVHDCELEEMTVSKNEAL